MKRWLSLLLCAAFFCAAFSSALADEEPVLYRSGGYAYALPGDGSALIWSYEGDETHVVIPDQLDGHRVTAIGELAFYGAFDMGSVTIPDSVTEIGGLAFFGCVSLTSVNIPDSVTVIGCNPFVYCESLETVTLSPDHPLLKLVDGALFGRTDNRLIACLCSSPRTSYEIPDGTAIIGEAAFYACSRLSTVVIPDSVTVIEADAFAYCGRLANLTIPAGVKYIGDGAFEGCEDLTAEVYHGSYAAAYFARNRLPYRVFPYVIIGEEIRQDGVTNRKVNMRKRPDTTSEVLEQLPAGETVFIISEGRQGENGETRWARVRYHGAEGYIQAAYIDSPYLGAASTPPPSPTPAAASTPPPSPAPAPAEADDDLRYYPETWLRPWHREAPASTLAFSDNGDRTLHMTVTFEDGHSFEADMSPEDYQTVEFANADRSLAGGLFIDPATGGCLEMYVYADSVTGDFAWLAPYFTGDPLVYETSDPIDLDAYEWNVYGFPTAEDWEGHWVMTGQEDCTLDIRGRDDGLYSVRLVFPGEEPVECTAEQWDFFSLSFRDPRLSGLLDHDRDAHTVTLSEPAASSAQLQAFLGGRESLVYTRTGEPEIPAEEEAHPLFLSLEPLYFMSSSGVGAWEGTLEVDRNGGFSGEYYDTDDDLTYEVTFSGRFGEVEQVSKTVYRMKVISAETAEEPGTYGKDEEGRDVRYEPTLLPLGAGILVTLPGTPDAEIPGTVQSLIHGTFWNWDEDCSEFATLTLADSGWGFFAETDETFTMPAPPSAEAPAAPRPVETPAPKPEPAPTAVPPYDPAESLTPVSSEDPDAWTGYWMTRDGSQGELILSPGPDGSPRMQAFFLRTVSMGSALVPVSAEHLAFNADDGAFFGLINQPGDGTLRFRVLGGLSMDEEHEFFPLFDDTELIFYPAAYEDLWYEEPVGEDAGMTDWFGHWVAKADGHTSVIDLDAGGDYYLMRISFDGQYVYSGVLEETDASTMVFVCDGFSGLLTLNRKHRTILITDCGSEQEGVNACLDAFHFTPEYKRFGDAEEFGVDLDVPDPEAEMEMDPVPGYAGCYEVPLVRVDATSWIVGSKDPYAYIPGSMIDGDDSTSYQFSTKTTPLGQAYMYFLFEDPYEVSELWIKNGSWRVSGGTEQYTRNCRIRTMTVSCLYENGTAFEDVQSITLSDNASLRDWTVIPLHLSGRVTEIRIRVDSVYTGTKFKTDVCVTEIMFVYRDDR